MKQTLNAKIHNRFDLEVVDAQTGKVRQKAFAENIILNQSWEQILQQRRYNPKWFSGIAFGTGTGTLAASRTTLFANLGNKTATERILGYDAENSVYNLRRKITLLETEYNGSVLTEVGIWDTVSSKLMTHALLKDMNGNTVAITKVDTDILYIYATTYLKISNTPAKDAAIDFFRCEADFNPLIAGLLGVEVSTEPSMGGNVYTACDTFPTFMDFLYGSHESFSPYSDFGTGDRIYRQGNSVAFDINNKKATMYLRVPAAEMNTVTGVKTYMMTCYRHDWARLMPAIVGHFPSAYHTQAQIVEQVGVGDGSTLAYETTFPFVRSGATIKVDGTVVSPTVITGIPNQKNIVQYLYNLGKGDGYKSKSASLTNYPATDPEILENPFYATYSIDSITATNITLYTSDDMETWTQVYSGSGTYTVAAEHKQKRYWKATMAATTKWAISAVNVNTFDNVKNIVFSTAPATGAVITAEYDTDVSAKDVNHVLDITVVIQLGEYT